MKMSNNKDCRWKKTTGKNSVTWKLLVSGIYEVLLEIKLQIIWNWKCLYVLKIGPNDGKSCW